MEIYTKPLTFDGNIPILVIELDRDDALALHGGIVQSDGRSAELDLLLSALESFIAVTNRSVKLVL